MKTTLLLLLLAAVPAASQTNVDRESQDRSRRGGAEQKAAEAAEKAAAASSSDEIGFARILKAPGDVDLNERFAREQIHRGDLRGAASTLERVLILAPGRDRARLLYAAVLYRLDALVDAERELRILLGRLAPAELIAEANVYLKLIEGRRRKTHFDARVTVGYGFDDNRNAASDHDKALFFGTPVVLNPNSRRQDDTNVTLSAALGASREFGSTPQRLFGGVGYYRGEQTRLNNLDLQAYSAHAGLGLRFLGLDFVPAAGFDHVLLSQATYLRGTWQSLRVSKRLRAPVTLWAEGRREDQDFLRTRLVPNGDDRKGDQYDMSLGASWVATPRDRAGFTAGHRRKLAKNVVQAYRRESVGVDYTRLLGRGTFMLVGVTGQFDRYDRPDTAVSTDARNDDAVITNLLVGAPLSLFWKPLKGFTGTLGWERFSQHSNIVTYTYSNNKLSAMVSYKWGI